MRNQTINLNLIPGGVMPVVHLSQFDQDVDGSLIFNIYNGPVPYDLTDCVAHIQGHKPDGTAFDYQCTVHETYVTSATEYQMTVVAGQYQAEMRISKDGSVVGTVNLVFSVEPSTLTNVDLSHTDIPELMTEIEQAVVATGASAEDAEESAEDSEAWAVGQRNGSDVPDTDPTYHNNAKYWSGQAGRHIEDAEAWAIGERGGVPVTSGDETYHNNSKYYSEESEGSAEDSEAWAVGERNGTPVSSGDPTYQNNSEYYSGQSESYSQDSEAWAVGERGGTPVTSGDPTYENNAEYYAGEASSSAMAAGTSKTNAATSEDNAEAWATGQKNGSDVPATDPAYHNNSKYYSEQAEDSAEDAEAWAAGTRGGIPVPSTDPAYHNNSKYWSDKSAAQTLNGLSDVDIDNPSDGESLVYDAQADKWTNKAATSHFITKPTVSDFSFTYNGSAQGPTITGLDPDFANYVTTTGATNTDAGTYTLRFSIKNTQVNLWKDLTTQDITYEYTIAKAAGDVTLSKNKVELDADHLTGTVDISDATGNVAITSSDTDIATVSPAVLTQDGTVTISSVNDKSGTATVTVSVAASTNYLATSKTIEVKASFVAIYGAEWDGTSTTAWSRTDDSALFTDPVPQHADGNGGWTQGSSPFDTLQPWAGMTKINHASAGVVVKIPKFWYKITQSGAGLKIQIADGEVDGFSVSPAHMDRGDGEGERDEVMVGRYHCCNTDYKSATSDTPKVNVTRSAARSGIHDLGSDIWQMDFATRFTLWLLYIVEFADWNSQAKIGGGCAPTGSTSAVRNMGYTDGMTYHTGTDQTTIGAEVYGGTQYRNIEGLWDNCYDWLDGCYYNANGLNIILDPSSFSDDTGGTAVGIPTSGYPSAFTKKEVSGTYPMFIPSASSGSATTYSCDNWYFSASLPCVYAGGYYNQSQNLGLFYLSYTSVSGSNAYRGCRLLVLP